MNSARGMAIMSRFPSFGLPLPKVPAHFRVYKLQLQGFMESLARTSQEVNKRLVSGL